MRSLSLFSGIGAHDLGLEWAGFEIVGQVENDTYAQKILKKHWPKVPKWGDIRSVTAADIRRHCGRIDLITGGFPCQDLSVAGQGKGLAEGERSGLWREMWRLIRDLRPKVILLENVPALRVRGADGILLSLETLDYSCAPLVVGARHTGAPHWRKRVWIVGYATGDRREKRSLGKKGREIPFSGYAGASLFDTNSLRLREQQGWCTGASETIPSFTFPTCPGEQQHPWEEAKEVESEMGRTADGTSVRLALKAIGNSNPPQVVACIGRALLKTLEEHE